jgi:hypothetical protein
MPLLDEEDWLVLLKAIERKQCILLLGPGAAVDPDDPKGDPLPIRLAQKLAAKLDQAAKGQSIIDRSDLAHVAQVYTREMPKKRPGLELAVEEFYAPYRERTTQVHLDLAALPFVVCISTTPERFLLNAFAQTLGKEPIYDFYHFQPNPMRARKHAPASPPPANQPEKHPLIYDLYGSLDETDSLVLTENDLLDFLVNATKQSPALHSFVSSQFSDLVTCFLFLGFGFRHWYVRILLHALKASGHQAPSLALEDAAFFLPEHLETAFFFHCGHLIEFRQLPWLEFAAELRWRYEDKAKLDKAKLKEIRRVAPEIPGGSPVVFLCHQTRDKAEAAHRYGTRAARHQNLARQAEPPGR